MLHAAGTREVVNKYARHQQGTHDEAFFAATLFARLEGAPYDCHTRLAIVQSGQP
jgi:hypothetical protein